MGVGGGGEGGLRRYGENSFAALQARYAEKVGRCSLAYGSIISLAYDSIKLFSSDTDTYNQPEEFPPK